MDDARWRVRRQRKPTRRRVLRSAAEQRGDGDPGAAFIRFAAAIAGAVRRCREIVLHGAPQRAAADAVDDAYVLFARQYGAVEEAGELVDRFSGAQADQAELAVAGLAGEWRRADRGARRRGGADAP